MQESTSREKVLKAIRDAMVVSMDPPGEAEDYADKIYTAPQSEFPEVEFAEALAKVGGQFVYNSNMQEFAVNFASFITGGRKDTQVVLHCFEQNLQEILNEKGIFCINTFDEISDCEVGVTSCEYLIARLGSVMVSSRLGSGRKGFFWPPVHIVVAWKDQMVFDLKQAFAELKKKYAGSGLPSMITVITGPSRTADIEKTLVMGAHGPAKLVVFFIDQAKEFALATLPGEV